MVWIKVEFDGYVAGDVPPWGEDFIQALVAAGKAMGFEYIDAARFSAARDSEIRYRRPITVSLEELAPYFEGMAVAPEGWEPSEPRPEV